MAIANLSCRESPTQAAYRIRHISAQSLWSEAKYSYDLQKHCCAILGLNPVGLADPRATALHWPGFTSCRRQAPTGRTGWPCSMPADGTCVRGAVKIPAVFSAAWLQFGSVSARTAAPTPASFMYSRARRPRVVSTITGKRLTSKQLVNRVGPAKAIEVWRRYPLHRLALVITDQRGATHIRTRLGLDRRPKPQSSALLLTLSTPFGVSAGHFAYFRVVSRIQIRCFRRSVRFLQRVRFPAAPELTNH